MTSNKTPNLGLNMWQPDDYFKPAEELNGNFGKLDDKIGILQTNVNNNATQLTQNSNQVNGIYNVKQ